MLLNKENSGSKITDEFIEKFAAVIGSMWPVLASLLSFTTAEIEQIKRKITSTVPTPTVKTYAAAMLKKWRDGATATFGILTDKVKLVCMHALMGYNGYSFFLQLTDVLIDSQDEL